MAISVQGEYCRIRTYLSICDNLCWETYKLRIVKNYSSSRKKRNLMFKIVHFVKSLGN